MEKIRKLLDILYQDLKDEEGMEKADSDTIEGIKADINAVENTLRLLIMRGI